MHVMPGTLYTICLLATDCIPFLIFFYLLWGGNPTRHIKIRKGVLPTPRTTCNPAEPLFMYCTYIVPGCVKRTAFDTTTVRYGLRKIIIYYTCFFLLNLYIVHEYSSLTGYKFYRFHNYTDTYIFYIICVSALRTC